MKSAIRNNAIARYDDDTPLGPPRIVTTAYRPKRPPRKRKAVAIGGAAVVRKRSVEAADRADQATADYIGPRRDCQAAWHSAQQCLSGVGGVAAASFGSGRILWMQRSFSKTALLRGPHFRYGWTTLTTRMRYGTPLV